MQQLSLGETVLIERRRQGLSQEGLAALVGVSSLTIARLERGQTKAMHITTLTRLSQVLGIAIDELGTPGGDDDPSPNAP